MSRLRFTGPLAVALITACASSGAPAPPADAPAAGPTQAPAGPIDRDVGPVFTPFTDAPELRNREEVAAALERHFPLEKRDEGGNWMTQVWLFIRDDGVVERLEMAESSGDPVMDDAALQVARVMRFSPAENRGEPVAVWFSLPIAFRTR